MQHCIKHWKNKGEQYGALALKVISLQSKVNIRVGREEDLAQLRDSRRESKSWRMSNS